MKSQTMRRTAFKPNLAPRSGATILEVMFAIFVVIIGLMGIASILPLAARNASDSNAHNNAQALGQRWFQSFFAFRFNEHNALTRSQLGYNWQWYRDYGNTPGFELFEKSYVAGSAAATRIGIAPGTNESSTNSQNPAANRIDRVWGHQAVCIDPVFFTEPEVRGFTSSNTTGRNGAYRLSVFPYFDDGYNPLTDPFAPSMPWPDQPRMIRATLGFGINSQVSRKIVEDIFISPDDIASFADEKDRTIPATRVFDSSLSKALANGQYSWMATLSPQEPVGITPGTATSVASNYLISVVVMNRRDREFVAPGPLPPPGNEEDKPAGERLLWVVPLSGSFTGGNGGRVRLVGNAATSNVLRIGDWIMLGKHYMIDTSAPVRRYAFFRWYRIIAVDQETRKGLLSDVVPAGDPFGNAASQPVWSRDVVLEGPDFDMSSPVNGFTTPVTGTLVNGVVTVVERNVNID
jgi:hypothetical protein